MQTQVINDGSCIRLINDNSPIIISKAQIRTIDTVKDELVRIDIGEGPLRNIFIKFTDLTAPAGLADVNALRDAIKAMLDGTPTGTISGGTTDLTPLVSILQNENSKLLDIQTAINALAQQLTTADGTQNLPAIKQSVDALGTAIANAVPSVELQLIHDEIVNSGNITKTAVQGLAQQMSGSTATQLSFLAGIQQGVENLATVLANASPATSIQSMHSDLTASGNTQAAILTNILQALNLIHSSQGINNALLYPIRIDDIDGLTVYNGFAVSSAAEGPSPADSVWAIQRVTNNDRGLYVYEWANGNQQFVNIWDNRASLNYAPLGAPLQTPGA